MDIVLSESDFIRQHMTDVFFFRIFGFLKKVRFVSILQRGEIGNSRSNSQNILVVAMKHLHIFWNFRTGADKTHFAFQHVEQLR